MMKRLGDLGVVRTQIKYDIKTKLHRRRPQTVCVFKSEHSATRVCDVQSWETKECKAEAELAVESEETHVNLRIARPR